MELPIAEVRSEPVEVQLVEMLFDQSAVLIVGGLVPASAAALAFVRTGHRWYIWWGIASTLVLVCRLAVDAAFRRRRVRNGRPTQWRHRFLIGAWANGACCGIGGAVSIFTADAFTQMLVITMLTAFVMGSAARNGTYPKAAIGSVLLTEVPLILACVATRDLYYGLFTIFAVLFTLSALSVVRHISSRTVQLLIADERNAALVREIGRSNEELGNANANFVLANEQLAKANANFAAANGQLEEANGRLAAMASTDGLTGLANRRAFDASFDTETRAARRDGTLLSVLMFDIDSFKKYNDRYGHQAGDECLRSVALALAGCVHRPRDLMARYGGEEFVAILPQTDQNGALALAETMRAAVADLELEHAEAACGIVTVSIGVATSLPGEFDSAHDLLRRADGALYAAKASGRNRVHAATDALPPAAHPTAVA